MNSFNLASEAFLKGEIDLAHKKLSEAVTISPFLKYSIVKALWEYKYDYIVAPYEADS